MCQVLGYEGDGIFSTKFENVTNNSQHHLFHFFGKGLLAHGHQVTGVFPQHSDIRNENYTEIVVEDR